MDGRRTMRGSALRLSLLCLVVWAAAVAVDKPPPPVPPEFDLDVVMAALLCATTVFVWSAVDNTIRSLGTAAWLWSAPVLASLIVLTTVGRRVEVGRSGPPELVVSTSATVVLLAVALGFVVGSIGNHFYTTWADS